MTTVAEAPTRAPQPLVVVRGCVVCTRPSDTAECTACAIEADVVFERGQDQ